MVKPLDWDSRFFGFPVGAMEFDPINKSTLRELNQFKLVYIYSDQQIDQKFADQFGPLLKLTDEKLTYTKKRLSFHKNIPTVIHSVPASNDVGVQLQKLSIESGFYSRYKKDELIGQVMFEKLYITWITNAVNRSFADEVLVYKQQNEYAGVITLRKNKSIVNIGLIAIDQEYRSKGIGTILLHATENWCIKEKQIKTLSVVTQGDNTRACNFYEKNGFAITARQYVYHRWHPSYFKHEDSV